MSWFEDQFPTNPGPRVYYVFWRDEYNGGYHCWLAKTMEEAIESVKDEKGIEVERYGSFPTEVAESAEELLTKACGYEEDEEDDEDEERLPLHPSWIYVCEEKEEELSDEELDQLEKKREEYYSEKRLKKIWSKLDRL